MSFAFAHPPRAANTTRSAGPNDEGTAIEEDARMARRMKFWHPFRGALPGLLAALAVGAFLLGMLRTSPHSGVHVGYHGREAVLGNEAIAVSARHTVGGTRAPHPFPTADWRGGTAMKQRLLYLLLGAALLGHPR